MSTKPTRIIFPPETIELSGIKVSYTVRRSARARHLRITISPHNGVVVTMPARLKRYINPEEFLRDKEEWILRHLSRMSFPANSTGLEPGATLHFQGNAYRLTVDRHQSARPRISISNGELLVMLPDDFEGDLKETIKTWIKRQAERIIRQEAVRYAEIIGVEFNSLAVRDQKTKWGSCSKKGNLSFNWRLLLFPPQVRRYIVIHELCHLKHFNHSPRFWALVERYSPGYRESILWLKEHSSRMEDPLR